MNPPRRSFLQRTLERRARPPSKSSDSSVLIEDHVDNQVVAPQDAFPTATQFMDLTPKDSFLGDCDLGGSPSGYGDRSTRRQCLRPLPPNSESPTVPCFATETRRHAASRNDMYLFRGSFQSEGDEVSALTSSFAAWEGLSGETSTENWSDPNQGVMDGIRYIQKGYVNLLLAVQRLSLELDHVTRTSVPKKNSDEVQNLYAQASQSVTRLEGSVSSLKKTLDETVKALNECNRKLTDSDSKVEELQRSLADAEAKYLNAQSKLSDASFLATTFKETVEYCDLEDFAMGIGVSWAVEAVKGRYPNLDFEFINTEYKEHVESTRHFS